MCDALFKNPMGFKSPCFNPILYDKIFEDFLNMSEVTGIRINIIYENESETDPLKVFIHFFKLWKEHKEMYIDSCRRLQIAHDKDKYYIKQEPINLLHKCMVRLVLKNKGLKEYIEDNTGDIEHTFLITLLNHVQS